MHRAEVIQRRFPGSHRTWRAPALRNQVRFLMKARVSFTAAPRGCRAREGRTPRVPLPAPGRGDTSQPVPQHTPTPGSTAGAHSLGEWAALHSPGARRGRIISTRSDMGPAWTHARQHGTPQRRRPAGRSGDQTPGQPTHQREQRRSARTSRAFTGGQAIKPCTQTMQLSGEQGPRSVENAVEGPQGASQAVPGQAVPPNPGCWDKSGLLGKSFTPDTAVMSAAQAGRTPGARNSGRDIETPRQTPGAMSKRKREVISFALWCQMSHCFCKPLSCLSIVGHDGQKSRLNFLQQKALNHAEKPSWAVHHVLLTFFA